MLWTRHLDSVSYMNAADLHIPLPLLHPPIDGQGGFATTVDPLTCPYLLYPALLHGAACCHGQPAALLGAVQQRCGWCRKEWLASGQPRTHLAPSMQHRSIVPPCFPPSLPPSVPLAPTPPLVCPPSLSTLAVWLCAPPPRIHTRTHAHMHVRTHMHTHALYALLSPGAQECVLVMDEPTAASALGMALAQALEQRRMSAWQVGARWGGGGKSELKG